MQVLIKSSRTIVSRVLSLDSSLRSRGASPALAARDDSQVFLIHYAYLNSIDTIRPFISNTATPLS